MSSTVSERSSVAPELGWFLLPVITALAGVWAYGGRTGNPLGLISITALVLGGWLPFWRTVTGTSWADSLQSWRTWTRRETLPTLPYTQPQSPAAKLQNRLEQACAWWLDVGRTAFARPLQNMLLTAAVSILISLFIGREVVLLSVLFITVTELAVLWHGGQGHVGGAWTAVAMASLPWILGTQVGPAGGMQPYLAALSLGLLISLFSWASPLSILGPIIAAVYLTWQNAATAALWVLLLGLPAYLLLAQKPSQDAHHRTAGVWLLLMVLVYAVVL